MSTGVPLALRLARRARLSRTPEEDCSPHKLHRASAGDMELYRHAMIEAGYIVRAVNQEPYDPCPNCGWSPTGVQE